MTAEIALMNRYAVALAADSAVTTTYWGGGQRQTRYFKGANKIFSVSNQYPVGLMIYDAAALQGVPWEVIVKAYRGERGGTPRDQLREYADDLFDFIQNNKELFPEAQQDAHLSNSVFGALSRLTFLIANSEQKKDEIPAQFENVSKAIMDAAFIAGIEHKELAEKCASFKDQVLKESVGDPDYVRAKEVVAPNDLFEWQF